MSSLDSVAVIQHTIGVLELLELATCDDLLGPANGPEEIVADINDTRVIAKPIQAWSDRNTVFVLK